MGFFVGTDVGGTFTDLWVASDDGDVRVFKSPTTADVLGGVLDAVRLAADAYGLSFEAFCAGIARFGHGTTVGLNALLTGNAAPTVVLTTRGFGDTLEIGRLRRQTSGLNETEWTDAKLRNRIPPLVPRRRIVEIDERIDANGKVIAPLDEVQTREALRALRGQGIEAIAVCTLWATVNPVHERRLRELIEAELPGTFVSLSHEISPGVGEYARMSTTAANAALGPLAGRYLTSLESRLRQAGMRVPVLMMTCAGGVLPTTILNDRPAYALFSGPAGGVMGSRATGAQIGIDNILTMDVGGTSFDVGVIVSGKPIMRSEISVAGADIRVLSIDVESIGAGGGSIAWLDDSDRLNVGPRSATSNPGPACYGRGGTEPTVTDADLVLGILDPDSFFHGQIRLDVEKAEAAISPLARRLGLSIPEAAAGINRVADAKMADLLRRVCMVRGLDPRDFTCYAYGGGGPVHAASVCREAGIETVVVPMMNLAAVWSAFGAAGADVVHVYLSPEVMTLPVPGEAITAVFAELEGEANEALADEGIDPGDVVLERSLRVKHGRQVHAVDVPVKAGDLGDADVEQIDRDFTRIYEELFGKGAGSREGGIDITGFQVRAIGRTVDPVLAADATAAAEAPVVDQRVYWAELGGFAATPVVQAGEAGVGSEWLEGPALIRLPDTVIVVPPGQRAAGDGLGSVTIKTGSVQGQERKDIAHVA
jgi:N-methylhydantoinase A